MIKLLDYITKNKTITLVHQLNISKYNIISSLIGAGIFLNEKIIIVSDSKNDINKCLTRALSDDNFYSYSDELPPPDKESHVIIDSTIDLMKSDSILKSLDIANVHSLIVLYNIKVSKYTYEEYMKLIPHTNFLKMNFSHTHPHIKYNIQDSTHEHKETDNVDRSINIMKYILLNPFERQLIYTQSIDILSDELKDICKRFRKRCVVISGDEESHAIKDKFAAWYSSKLDGVYIMVTDILPPKGHNLYSITQFHIYGAIDKSTYYAWLDRIYKKNLHNIGYDNLNVIFHIYDDESLVAYNKLSNILSESRKIYKSILDKSDSIINDAEHGFCVRRSTT